MQIAAYTRPGSIEEAWTCNQQKGAVVLGGCCWLRLSPRRMIRQAIDLSALHLDGIEESAEAFRIGAMTPLRRLELSPSLARYTQGAAAEGLRHIVGTQFRNMATVGGSVCGRFGFSDVLTLLLALDAEVVLYRRGQQPLETFLQTGAGTDILTHVIIPKRMGRETRYASLRLNATDFPVIACAVSRCGSMVRCVIGARPGRAQAVDMAVAAVRQQGYENAAAVCAQAVAYGSNMRGSAAYRQDMAAVLCRRLLTQVIEEKNG